MADLRAGGAALVLSCDRPDGEFAVPPGTMDRAPTSAQAPHRPWFNLFFGREPLIYRILIWAERNRWKA